MPDLTADPIALDPVGKAPLATAASATLTALTDNASTYAAVAQALADARAAHAQYRAAVPRMEHQGGAVIAVAGDPAEAKRQLARAAQLRTQADALDPTHQADAWATDEATHPHQDLLAFYAAELEKP